MVGNEVKVGIADLNLVLAPGSIMTIGLGSCIGIALYDKSLKIAGLAHIMLPDSTQFKSPNNPMKFADLAIPILIEKMEKQDGNKRKTKVLHTENFKKEDIKYIKHLIRFK